MANKLPSILTAGNNQYPTPGISLNRFATDFFSPGIAATGWANTLGVSPATGNFAVNAQGAPNMTVAVSGGVAYVSAIPTGGTAQTFGVTADVSENVTIPANSSGSTVYDFLYLKLDQDKLNNPASNGLDVATYVTSRSTTAYSLSATANGNSNGVQANCLLLAVATVVNGAASIANASITDARRGAIPLITTAYKFNAFASVATTVAASAVPTKVTFGSKAFDTGGNFDAVTNNRFTAPITGYYWFLASTVVFVINTTTCQASLYKNGSLARSGSYVQNLTGGNSNMTSQVSGLLPLNAGDYVEAYQTDNQGSTSNTITGSTNTWFEGFLVSLT